MWSKDVCKKARKYDKADNFMISDEIYNLISKDLPSYKNLGNIVKLGCGTGRYTKLLAKIRKSGYCYKFIFSNVRSR